jgi:Putative addiction module component
MSPLESLLADASRLPVSDRLQLIDALWATVPAESQPAISPE